MRNRPSGRDVPTKRRPCQVARNAARPDGGKWQVTQLRQVQAARAGLSSTRSSGRVLPGLRLARGPPLIGVLLSGRHRPPQSVWRFKKAGKPWHGAGVAAAVPSEGIAVELAPRRLAPGLRPGLGNCWGACIWVTERAGTHRALTPPIYTRGRVISLRSLLALHHARGSDFKKPGGLAVAGCLGSGTFAAVTASSAAGVLELLGRTWVTGYGEHARALTDGPARLPGAGLSAGGRRHGQPGSPGA